VLGVVRASEVGTLDVQVFEVSTVTTSWVLSTALSSVLDNSSLSASLDKTHDLVPGRIYEIRRIEVRADDDAVAPIGLLIGGRDFVRAFFEVRDATDCARSPDDIRLAAYLTEEKQRIANSRPLGIPTASTKEFKVLGFVERCMLTERLRLPGFEIIPLPTGNPSLDEAALMNQVLRDFKWKAVVDPDAWAQHSSQQNPWIIFHFPRIYAESNAEAAALAAARRDEMLDLLALHRGSRGYPLALIVEDRSTGNAEAYPEFPIYEGNRLGGFISGEDTETLLRDSISIASDPLLPLFVSLFRDAQAERQVDFAFFRFWNLLEAIAVARIPSGQEITDFSGAPIKGRRETLTTSGGRGRVYQLLKELVHGSIEESSFAVDPAKNLWEMVKIWYAFRNAAAHYGGFMADDPEQRQQDWYAAANAAYQHLESLGTARRVGSDPYLVSLHSIARLVLHWQLNAVFQDGDH